MTRILDFLAQKNLGYLGTLNAVSKAPQGAMVYFAAENSALIICTAKNSRKIVNLRADGRVSLTIGDESKLLTLQLEGTAETIDDFDNCSHYLQLIVARISSQTNSLKMPLLMTNKPQDIAAIILKVSKFKFSDFSSDSPKIFEGTGVELFGEQG